MLNTGNLSIQDVVSAIVPINRFNRGEAGKIFDEVRAKGVKVVLKNNNPVCVLVEPERYEAMVDSLEDYALFFEAERRMNSAEDKTISQEQVLEELGILQEDLESVEVEIE